MDDCLEVQNNLLSFLYLFLETGTSVHGYSFNTSSTGTFKWLYFDEIEGFDRVLKPLLVSLIPILI